jgi:hypothetical protein
MYALLAKHEEFFNGEILKQKNQKGEVDHCHTNWKSRVIILDEPFLQI